MYGLLIALALAAGCATGTETGKDGEAAGDGVFGAYEPCPDDGKLYLEPAGRVPYVLVCNSGWGVSCWPVPAVTLAADERVYVTCDYPGDPVYVRWLD